MRTEIKQLYQKINAHDILNRKFYRVWFFTNERIVSFLQNIQRKENNFKKIFAVGGGGDFSFSILSLFKNIEKINVCDIRPMACLTIDLKRALIKNFSYEEISDLLSNYKFPNKNKIYERIRYEISSLSKFVLDSIIKNCPPRRIALGILRGPQNNFLQCLKKSGFWYRNSFWQIKHKDGYLFYLTSKNRYQNLQRNIDKVNIYFGDLDDNLKMFDDDYYDLIYVSNILDSKKYCQSINLYLLTIIKKLNQNGLLLMVTQNNPKKMIKLIEDESLKLVNKELHKFNILTSLVGHYCYSFLCFRKRDERANASQ